MSSVRVGILSDTSLFAEGIASLLRAEEGVHLVGSWDDDVRRPGARASRPEVLLVDGRMERALARCQQYGAVADLTVIVVAIADESPLAVDALIAGARGVLYQGSGASDLRQAIALVRQGKIWAPRHVVAAAWQKCLPGAEAGHRIKGWQRLSAREREVLRHAAAGFANKELADRLAITEATVKVHLTHIFQKIGCRSRSELAAAYHGVAALDAERPARTAPRL